MLRFLNQDFQDYQDFQDEGLHLHRSARGLAGDRPPPYGNKAAASTVGRVPVPRDVSSRLMPSGGQTPALRCSFSVVQDRPILTRLRSGERKLQNGITKINSLQPQGLRNFQALNEQQLFQ